MALIEKNIIDLLQFRIEQEEQSSRIYAAMSEWLKLKGYSNASKLWADYSLEELSHAGWAKNHLQALNILPITPKQEQPEVNFKGLPQIIALSYKHEIEITNQCKELASTCLKEGDLMTFVLAQKYMEEQVQEIEKARFWVDQLEQFGDSPISLRLLDEKMGQ